VADVPWNTLELLKDALLDHKVLILRAQHLDEPTHARLLRRFGTPAGAGTVPEAWVAAGSQAVAPPKVLSIRGPDAAARATGDVRDADVRIADTVGAYRDLPRPLRALADRTWAAHDDPVRGPGEPVAHPVTRLHTETGDRGLLLGGHARYILGLPDSESRTVLDLLQSYVIRPHNVFTWTPAPGEILLADARSIQLRAPAGTDVHRVAGDAPLGIDGQHSHPIPTGPVSVRRSA
jgi:taurine dioxygenase